MDFLSQCGSFARRSRYRKRFYRVPYHLNGLNEKRLFDIVAETGVQVLLPALNCEPHIGRCLQSIERAMEGKKWVLIVLEGHSQDRTFEIIQRHQTGALYFIKDQISFPDDPAGVFKQLLMLGGPFHEAFPWICFVRDMDGMHPLKIDFLLSRAIQHKHRAVAGDCLLFNGPEHSDSHGNSQTVKATDTAYWRDHLTAGLGSLLVHRSLFQGERDYFTEDFRNIYKEIVDKHWAPYEGRIINAFNTRTADIIMSAEPVEHRDNHIATQLPAEPTETNLESFSIVANRTLADELLVTIRSIRQYHQQPIYLVCDSYVKALVRAEQFENIIAIDELNESHLAQIRSQYFNRPYQEIWKFPPSQPNPPILIKKMDVISHALQNHRNTLIIDADLIFLSPIRRCFTESLVLSPEINDYRVRLNESGAEYFAANRDQSIRTTGAGKLKSGYRYQLHDVFGIFNAGFLFTKEQSFPGWWKERFLGDSKFLEQETMNRLCRDYTYGIFEEQYNFGFWKLWRLTTNQSKQRISRQLKGWDRLKFEYQCRTGDDTYVFNDYFELLADLCGWEEIGQLMGFQSGHGIWLNGRKLQSFHLHLFYTSRHRNLWARWNFIKDLGLYLIGMSQDEKHRELMSYIAFLTENRHGT
jgi:hypothetical protein